MYILQLSRSPHITILTLSSFCIGTLKDALADKDLHGYCRCRLRCRGGRLYARRKWRFRLVTSGEGRRHEGRSGALNGREPANGS
jgi:hypothetical protein